MRRSATWLWPGLQTARWVQLGTLCADKAPAGSAKAAETDLVSRHWSGQLSMLLGLKDQRAS